MGHSNSKTAPTTLGGGLNQLANMNRGTEEEYSKVAAAQITADAEMVTPSEKAAWAAANPSQASAVGFNPATGTAANGGLFNKYMAGITMTKQVQRGLTYDQVAAGPEDAEIAALKGWSWTSAEGLLAENHYLSVGQQAEMTAALKTGNTAAAAAIASASMGTGALPSVPAAKFAPGANPMMTSAGSSSSNTGAVTSDTLTNSYNEPNSSEFNQHNNDITVTETISAKAYRQQQHVPAEPPSGRSYIPQQYVDNDGPPYTLDPIRLDQWASESGTGAERSKVRGNAYAREALEQLMGNVAVMRTHSEPTSWQPTVADIPVGKLFPTPMGSGCVSYRGVARAQTNYGQLPVVSQLKYDGDLSNKSRDVIDAAMLAEQRRAGARLFNPTGRLATVR